VLLERYYHHLFTSDRHIAALYEELGMGGDANSATLNGLAFGGTDLPRDAVTAGRKLKPSIPREVDGIRFVNTGSVGRPKDGDWRAGYVVLAVDGSGVQVEFVRVEYDVAAAARAILESELPHEFAEFLESGGAAKS